MSATTNPQPTREAIAKLERAVALDPAYAPAWSELARRCYYDAVFGDGGMRSRERARNATSRALALDPELLSAVRRSITLRAESGDLPGAYRQALEMIKRRPRSPEAHFAASYVLRYAGQLEESARECNIAYSIDPSLELRSCGVTFSNLGDYARARDFVRLDAGSEWAAILEVSMLLREGRKSDALAVLRKVPSPHSAWVDEFVRCFERGAFEPSFAESYLQQALGGVDAEPMYFTSTEMMVCGTKERALQLLRHALDRRYSIYPVMDKDPMFDSIRADPEFVKIREEALRYYESLAKQIHSGVM